MSDSKTILEKHPPNPSMDAIIGTSSLTVTYTRFTLRDRKQAKMGNFDLLLLSERQGSRRVRLVVTSQAFWAAEKLSYPRVQEPSHRRKRRLGSCTSPADGVDLIMIFISTSMDGYIEITEFTRLI